MLGADESSAEAAVMHKGLQAQGLNVLFNGFLVPPIDLVAKQGAGLKQMFYMVLALFDASMLEDSKEFDLDMKRAVIKDMSNKFRTKLNAENAGSWMLGRLKNTCEELEDLLEAAKKYVPQQVLRDRAQGGDLGAVVTLATQVARKMFVDVEAAVAAAKS